MNIIPIKAPRYVSPSQKQKEEDHKQAEEEIVNEETEEEIDQADVTPSVSLEIKKKEIVKKETKKETAKKKKQLSDAQRNHLDKIRAKSLATRRANALRKKEAKADEVRSRMDEQQKKKELKAQALILAKEEIGIQRKAKESYNCDNKAKKRKEKNENLMNVLDSWYEKKQEKKRKRKAAAAPVPAKAVPKVVAKVQHKQTTAAKPAVVRQCLSKFSPFNNNQSKQSNYGFRSY
jgi:hypothetical protein